MIVQHLFSQVTKKGFGWVIVIVSINYTNIGLPLMLYCFYTIYKQSPAWRENEQRKAPTMHRH